MAKPPMEGEIYLATPQPSNETKAVPSATEFKHQTPKPDNTKKEVPEENKELKEVPSELPSENCVMIGGKIIEIKPTKLKYFRNKTASAYNLLKLIPLNEFLSYSKGQLGEKDPDQMLFDFLVAAFDGADVLKTCYDDLTADDVERVVQIFGRLNHIDEKEEAARKNREAQAKR